MRVKVKHPSIPSLKFNSTKHAKLPKSSLNIIQDSSVASFNTTPSHPYLFTNISSKSFHDWKRVKLYSGKGGDGSVAFEKSAKVLFGPPNGGNGGLGGSIYIKASKSVTNLNAISSVYRAAHGWNGKSHGLHGAGGADLEITVPVGTTVRQVYMNDDHLVKDDLQNIENLDDDEARFLAEKYFKFRAKYDPQDDRVRWLLSRVPPKREIGVPIFVDFTTDGQRHLVLKGGRAGLGNVSCINIASFSKSRSSRSSICIKRSAI